MPRFPCINDIIKLKICEIISVCPEATSKPKNPTNNKVGYKIIGYAIIAKTLSQAKITNKILNHKGIP